MDAESESQKAIWVFRFGIGLLLTTLFTLGELKYALFGKTVNGTVQSVETVEGRGRRGRTSTWREVNYTFVDKTGNARTGSDRVEDDFQAAPKSTISITYRGSDPDGPSRLAGHYNWFGIGVWCCFFLPTAWFFGGMIRESAQYAREKKARTAARPYRF